MDFFIYLSQARPHFHTTYLQETPASPSPSASGADAEEADMEGGGGTGPMLLGLVHIVAMQEYRDSSPEMLRWVWEFTHAAGLHPP